MKKTETIKILTALLALTFIFTSITSCGKKHVNDGVVSSEEDLQVIGTIGDYEICYDELRYVVLSCRDILENKHGKDIWDDEETAAKYEKELQAMVMERITANYAIFSLCEEYGFKNPLSKKDTVIYVDSQIDELIYVLAVGHGIKVNISENSDGTLDYKYTKNDLNTLYKYLRQDLASVHLTERVARITLGAEYAFEVLISILTVGKGEVIFLDDDIEEFMFSDEFICTRHIFIQNDAGDNYEENKKLAEKLLDDYKNGTSMVELIGSKYNEDFSVPYEGTYFTRNEMEKAYEEAAFALEVGEVSDVVEGENGFYIIERCEKSKTYMLVNLEKYADQITYAMVNKIVRDRQSELSLTLNDFGSSLVFHKIPAIDAEKN